MDGREKGKKKELVKEWLKSSTQQPGHRTWLQLQLLEQIQHVPYINCIADNPWLTTFNNVSKLRQPQKKWLTICIVYSHLWPSLHLSDHNWGFGNQQSPPISEQLGRRISWSRGPTFFGRPCRFNWLAFSQKMSFFRATKDDFVPSM